MPRPSDRTSKKKFYTAPGGEARIKYIRGRNSIHKCANCGGQMHGVPHGQGVAGTRRLSHSQRRPSALFAGMLCTKCRTIVVTEAAKISAGLKTIEDVNFDLKTFVEEAKKQVR